MFIWRSLKRFWEGGGPRYRDWTNQQLALRISVKWSKTADWLSQKYFQSWSRHSVFLLWQNSVGVVKDYNTGSAPGFFLDYDNNQSTELIVVTFYTFKVCLTIYQSKFNQTVSHGLNVIMVQKHLYGACGMILHLTTLCPYHTVFWIIFNELNSF